MNDTLNTNNQELMSEQGYSFKEIFFVLKKRKSIIINTFLVILALVSYYTLISKPIYQSKSLVMVSEDQNSMSMLDMGILGHGNNYIQNEIEILKSRTISELTVKKLLNSKFRDSLYLFKTRMKY